MATFVLLAMFVLLAVFLSIPLTATPYTGRLLTEVLEELRQEGVEVVYTSRLVRSHMRVESEPEGTTPETLLQEILAPWALAARPVAEGRWVVERRRLGTIHGWVQSRESGLGVAGVEIKLPAIGASTQSGPTGRFQFRGLAPGRYTLEAKIRDFEPLLVEQVEVLAGLRTALDLTMQLATVQAEIVVTSGDNEGSGLGLGREVDRRELTAAGQLAQDPFAALRWLTGVGGAEGAAQFEVYGGSSEEVMVVLDGHEVVEPYHLRDFGSLLGIISPGAVEEVKLHRGFLPAAWGDRMGGVLEMTSPEPEDFVHALLSAGSESEHLGISGTFWQERFRWLATYRQGEPDVAGEVAETSVRPTYWDGFGKLSFALGERHDVSAQVLLANDLFFFTNPISFGNDQFITDHEMGHLWLRHSSVFGSRLLVESMAHHSRTRHERFGAEVESAGVPEDYALSDRRRLESSGLRGSFTLHRAPHELRWGLETRRTKASYDYRDDLVVNRPEFFDGLASPELFGGRFRAVHSGAFVAERRQVGRDLVLETALRLDHVSHTDEALLSPRLGVVWAPQGVGTWRGSWGIFHQSQRVHELEVADGETEFHFAEQTEHRSLGFERLLGRDTTLRLDVYQRLTRAPRPRYENLYKPVSRFPEIERDRVRVAPERGRAHGIEVEWTRSGEWLDYRLSYVLSRSEDLLDGSWRLRSNDRPHAVRFDLHWNLGQHWQMHGTWRGRSGRPTTALEILPTSEGGFEVVPGIRNGERLSAEHQLDLRLQRSLRLGRFGLRLDLGIDNVYDHRSVRGFDTRFEVRELPGGVLVGAAEPELGRGLTLRWGIRLEY